MGPTQKEGLLVSALSKRWRGLLGTLLATGTIAGFALVAAAPSAHAAFPGTNGPIVWVNNVTSGLQTLDPSTGVASVLCPFAACGNIADERPEVSANGQTIVFVNAAGIATIPITGGGFTQITSDGGDDPSFTPDGGTIVYQVSNVLKRVAATGGSSTSISGANPATEPEVSPNGATVAYINNNNDNLETIPIGGGLPNVVISDTGETDQVSWSPDGTKIAVTDLDHCAVGGNPTIGVVSATANNAAPTCLPNSQSNDFDPSFSPDGTKIAVANTSGNPSILNANGIGRTDFTSVSNFFENVWAVQATTTTTTTAPGPTTTTTPPPPCSGTLTGTAFKGSNPKPKKALAGV